MKKILLLAVTLLTVSFADAEISLPQLFQSGMVLQRGKLIPIWGKAAPGELVTVRFNKKQYATTADAHGSWRINLPKMKAGGPYTLTVGNHVLTNILVGDVWLLSGQSNIDVTIERVYPQYPQEIDSYENNDVRLFRVQNETDVHGVRDDIKPTSINWKPLNKENAWLFSAVGYFLGKRMQEKTNVPQGIIVNSWGGTPIEAWISKDSLERDYPMLVKRAQFFQSDDYVKSQTQTNMQADRQWQKMLQESDAGILQNWAAPDCDDANWQSINQNDWSWRGCGSVWLRQHIIINKEHAGKPARLLLGTLFDQDIKGDWTYLLSVSPTSLRYSRGLAQRGRQRDSRPFHQQIRGSALHSRKALHALLRRRPLFTEPHAERRHTPCPDMEGERWHRIAQLSQWRHHALQCRASSPCTLYHQWCRLVSGRVEHRQSCPLC